MRFHICAGAHILVAWETETTTAILLIGGEKRGDKRFYSRMIALADKLYGAYLDGIRRKDRN
jgi:hypothetical protein